VDKSIYDKNVEAAVAAVPVVIGAKELEAKE